MKHFLTPCWKSRIKVSAVAKICEAPWLDTNGYRRDTEGADGISAYPHLKKSDRCGLGLERALKILADVIPFQIPGKDRRNMNLNSQ